VLDVRERPGEPVQVTLCEALRTRDLLLVVDNCEHLAAACAELVDNLLRACPRLRVVATSRQWLDVAGETIWRVPSLAVPDSRVATGADEITACEAVRLFYDRARSALPEFVMHDRNVAIVAQICRRLDGIPLALELAAARVRLLAPEQILERLDDRLRLLVGGSRTAPSRHQTLRAMADWSYAHLDEPERVLLRRLSVFTGGWTLESAEVVCALRRAPGKTPLEASSAAIPDHADARDDLAGDDVLEVLGRLVDRSLVLADTQSGSARYRLLETIRQYAFGALVDTGEAEAIQSRHAAWYLALAEQGEPALLGPDQTTWFERLEREHDNFRVALRWSIGRGEAEPSLRLAGALAWFWGLRGFRS
jgi:predicted ATPase